MIHPALRAFRCGAGVKFAQVALVGSPPGILGVSNRGKILTMIPILDNMRSCS